MLFPGLLNVYPHNNIISVKLLSEKHNHHQNNKLSINQLLITISVRTLSDNNGHFIAPNHAPGSILPPNLPPKMTLLRSSFQFHNVSLYASLSLQHNRHESVCKTLPAR
jgi:hypothetical protein